MPGGSVKSKFWAIVAALVLVVGAVVLVIVLTGEDDKTAVAGESSTGSHGSTPTDGPTEQQAGQDVDPYDEAFVPAESEPLEDSLYPNVGDPGVDALHYHLDIAWDADEEKLTGTTTLAFRATQTAPEFRLDLGDPLEVEKVTLDGREVEAEHNGKDLVVKAPVRRDRKYALVVQYSGTPEPAKAPTTRSDFNTSGWTVDDDGEVWTMQEPYGALHVVPRQRPAVRQGVLRLHHHRARRLGRRRQRAAEVAGEGRRQHRHRVEPGRARRVVPHHDRDRRHGQDRGRRAPAACR